MADTVKMRLLVGVSMEDWDGDSDPPEPTVAGAWDYSIYEIVDDQEWNQWLTRAKRSLDPYENAWEWREVTVELPADALKSLFAVKTVTGEVISDE